MLAVGRKAQPSVSVSSRPDAPPSSSSRKTSSSCRLSFYEEPPAMDVDVDMFETYGISRLQVLRRIDVLQARGVKGDRFEKEVLKADLEHLFQGSGSSNKDQVSHYILRMAYCQTEELRRWFLTNECLLFKLRFETARPADVDRFLREQKMLLKYPPISDEEKMRLRPKLLGFHQAGNTSDAAAAKEFLMTKYYRVPFGDVLPLVGRREVYLEAGYAYVSRTKILSIVEGKFRTSLSKSLARAYQMQYLWSSDARIGSVIGRLSKVAFRYGSGGGGLAGNGGSANTAHATTQIFVDYLKTVMGHSDVKTKPAGVNKLFVSVGTKKPNVADKTCPIAGRIHKSNTQKYTIYFDTLVMEQGCWDGCCQATNKHVYYQIKCDAQGNGGGRCAKVGWNPPQLDPAALRATLVGMGCAPAAGSSPDATTPAKKQRLSTSVQVSP